MTDAIAAGVPALSDSTDSRIESGSSAIDSLPGHLMMWVLIFSELAAFGALLIGFQIARALQPEAFAAGQGQLDPALAAANTLCLVSSGWFAAKASAAARNGARDATWRSTVGACLLGAVFIAIKLFEYAGEIGRGADIDGNTFFTLYFLLTGFHLLHVALGLAILLGVAWHAHAAAVESGTCFWHMVDLVWLVMFPIVYLMR
ncbi:cytochrome c oxidase subunit 3 family protein [Rhodopseudomonas palustris]|uniref:Cytochrome c oxidase subunit 3 family protein n=1 Tax=Rhodopseudomonas palustris (strain ATCC BAA-98 / CGA009) TaxID=258594 RepID=Q6N9T3_RHOPA|nr:cytochrome c oxidase subunit 3 family protein [Rhodopseudomonas palustris]OPF91309.1 copper oxidase [Rhodopseudomonas palustris]PPQ43862.1 copper oxidase [Rhodopseudomonas palustris]QQM02953.1 putative cytochrome c oxidase subunit 3 [Rhodopseudomonas palustris]RJF60530.1 cytochrome c oxidase subunit 3 family protein [Rhodopseudomonas palustris]WAB79126.1 cytochrome c oxidase subunit 3 family protein [Rhodopseudomonas palustris]